MKISKNLKSRIIIGYTIGIIIPLVIITIFSYRRNVQILEKKAEIQLGVASEAINEQYNTFFKDIEAISRDIIKNSLIQEQLKRNSGDIETNLFSNVTAQNEIETYFMGIYSRKPGMDLRFVRNVPMVKRPLGI